MKYTFTSNDGRYVVTASPLVILADGPAAEAAEEPPWSELPEDMLVLLAGLSGKVPTAHGWTEPHPFGFTAQAELSRRLTAELAAFRIEAEQSSSAVVRLTRALVKLTWALMVVTILLGAATIIVAVGSQ